MSLDFLRLLVTNVGLVTLDQLHCQVIQLLGGKKAEYMTWYTFSSTAGVSASKSSLITEIKALSEMNIERNK